MDRKWQRHQLRATISFVFEELGIKEPLCYVRTGFDTLFLVSHIRVQFLMFVTAQGFGNICVTVVGMCAVAAPSVVGAFWFRVE